MTDQPIEPQPAGVGLGEWDGPEPEEPTDAELFGLWPDPFAGPPDGDDAWPADVSDPGLDHGFDCGAPLDVLPPDEMLAGFAARAYDGLGRLSDNELVGLLCAARRLSAWQAAVELGVVAELDSRRRACAERPDSSRLGEQVSAELAAALTLTGRSADSLLGLARDLRRLPTVFASLFSGRIDRAKAAVFAAELAVVSDKVAAAIAMALREAAARMTTGQLRAELRYMVLMFEPDALRQRAERGRDQTRVETWQESSGNWGIAGRELPAADAISADKRLTAIARALKDAGADGNLDQLRAAVFTALLTGRDPQALVPPGPGETRGERAAAAVRTGSCGCAGGIGGLTGSINLTMPLATWFGASDAPGEAAGLGPVDADTSRDLATRLTTRAQWCVTLTDADGRAAAHACARASPDTSAAPRAGPDKSPAAAWLASLRFEWLERGECGHRRESRAYRPSRTLRHLIKIRQRTCGHPGCRRPAQDCDDDHTIPYQQGGRTCECNLGPFCRRHHKVKQAPGWHVRQPQPGTFIWTTPHGRSYTVLAGKYPA